MWYRIYKYGIMVWIGGKGKEFDVCSGIIRGKSQIFISYTKLCHFYDGKTKDKENKGPEKRMIIKWSLHTHVRTHKQFKR